MITYRVLAEKREALSAFDETVDTWRQALGIGMLCKFDRQGTDLFSHLLDDRHTLK